MSVDSRKEIIWTGNLINNVVEEGYLFHLRARLVDYLFLMSQPTLFLGPTLKKKIFFFLLSDRPCPKELFFLMRTAF